MTPVVAAVALGSNLGDRDAHLRFATARLGSALSDLRVSRFIETAPVGVSSPQPPYLNGAAVGRTALTPRELLATLLAIERDRGRQRPFTGAPRTLDLDLVLYGALVLDEPGLSIPHPRFRERRFVLEPLAEVGAFLIDPVTRLSVGELLGRLRGG